MNFKAILVVLLFALSFSFSALAQKATTPVTTQTTLPADTMSVFRLRNEYSMLKDKVETLNTVNDKLINTIYAIIAIFIGLIALNWLGNFKLNQRKIDEIEGNLNNKFSAFNNDYKSDYISQKATIKDELTDLIKELNEKNIINNEGMLKASEMKIQIENSLFKMKFLENLIPPLRDKHSYSDEQNYNFDLLMEEAFELKELTKREEMIGLISLKLEFAIVKGTITKEIAKKYLEKFLPEIEKISNENYKRTFEDIMKD